MLKELKLYKICSPTKWNQARSWKQKITGNSQEGGGVSIYLIDLRCCTAETNTIL